LKNRIKKEMEKMITTKKIGMIIGILLLLTILPISAQNPSWAKKATNAVFTLKTFNADGSLLGSSNGFFIGEQGQAISSFSPFKNAQRAVIIDAQGKEIEVECLMGYNDMYDVAKFQVAAKKTQALSIAQSPANSGANLWLIPYSVKKVPNFINGTVNNAEKFGEGYSYYTLNITANDQQVGSPLLNEQGEVIGILQPSANDKQNTGYAVSALFANNLRLTGLSMNDPVLRSVKITKALPDDQNEATLALYVSASAMDAAEYNRLIDRFIEKFPKATDGYVYRARQEMNSGNFQSADDDMKLALKVADAKDDAHYQYAQLIFQKNVFQADKSFAPWTLDLALQESKAAYAINPQPIYRQQQAQILYAQEQYDAAYELYIELAKTDMMKAESYYSAAQCKMRKDDKEAALALLDSAINTFTKPYIKTAAPYLLTRAQVLYEAKKYRPAVNDYNDYETLMAAQVNANFYFLREQAEFAGHLYQQALNDIRRAVEMAPDELVYRAEKANVELRVGMIDDAIESAKGCVSIAPGESDGYLFLGLAQCVKGLKTEGLKNLEKAKELGNSQAQSLIDKYSK
jgi:tetratricopeptide (TPR) repeat protein